MSTLGSVTTQLPVPLLVLPVVVVTVKVTCPPVPGLPAPLPLLAPVSPPPVLALVWNTLVVLVAVHAPASATTPPRRPVMRRKRLAMGLSR